MAGPRASRWKDLERVASGAALVFNELLVKSPAVGKLRRGDILGSTTTVLRYVQNTVTDITGLTQGRLRSHPSESKSLTPNSYLQSDSSTFRGSDDAGILPSKQQALSTAASQPEEMFRPASSPAGDRDSVREPEETIAARVTPLKSNLYGATCVSGRDNFSPEGENNLDDGKGPAFPASQEPRDSGLSSSFQREAFILQEGSEVKTSRPSAAREGGGVSVGLSENKSGTTTRQFAKKRKLRERRVPSTPFSRAFGLTQASSAALGTVTSVVYL